jgi:hypothetical protein
MAHLEPGIRFGNAPHFQISRSWSDRLLVNSGVVAHGDCLWPRDDWRPLSTEELGILTTAEVESDDALLLFNIPERLHTRWWDFAAAEADQASKGTVTFKQFAGEMLEYLHFKRLPLPPACAFEVVVNASGQPSTRPQMGGLTAQGPIEGLRGGINLSDQEAALVVLNLGEKQLSIRQTGLPAENSFHQQVRAFLSANLDYPLLRVALLPGEGYWLPRGPVALDGDTRGRSEIDVQLLIRAPGK